MCRGGLFHTARYVFFVFACRKPSDFPQRLRDGKRTRITRRQKNFDNMLAKQVFKMKQKANRGDKLNIRE